MKISKQEAKVNNIVIRWEGEEMKCARQKDSNDVRDEVRAKN